MAEDTYFEHAGESSGASGRFVRVDDVEAFPLAAGLDAQPVSGESVMASFVTLAPNAVAAEH